MVCRISRNRLSTGFGEVCVKRSGPNVSSLQPPSAVRKTGSAMAASPIHVTRAPQRPKALDRIVDTVLVPTVSSAKLVPTIAYS
jgi:hypothetical protein